MSRQADSVEPVGQRARAGHTGWVVFLLVLLNLQILVFTVPAVCVFFAWNKVQAVLEEEVRKGSLKIQDEVTAKVHEERARIHQDLTEVIRAERAQMEAAVQEMLEKDTAKTRGRPGK
jgi:hypothetical protein